MRLRWALVRVSRSFKVTCKVQFVCSLLVYAMATASASAQTQTGIPTDEQIIAQMAQAQEENRVHFGPYKVTRDYKVFKGDNQNLIRSHLIAEISVIPPDSKKYAIDNSNGSLLEERIVRKMLDGEVAFAKSSHSSDITRNNYDFRFIREDVLSGEPCYVLALIPKRTSRNLLRGLVWVDARSYLPLRVEGEPAQNPSWWVTDARIVLLYGYIGPMWLQTSSEATANVRIIGQSTLIWQDVKYQLGEPASGANSEIVLRLDPPK
jgi:outer membrane lipoprotein-sorting protein